MTVTQADRRDATGQGRWLESGGSMQTNHNASGLPGTGMADHQTGPRVP